MICNWGLKTALLRERQMELMMEILMVYHLD